MFFLSRILGEEMGLVKYETEFSVFEDSKIKSAWYLISSENNINFSFIFKFRLIRFSYV